jgi:hypothetical protein
MKMMTERSKRSLLRQIDEEKVRFLNGKFLYKANNKEVKGIVFKKKFRDMFDDDEEFEDEEEDEQPGFGNVGNFEPVGQKEEISENQPAKPADEPAVVGGGSGIKITF